MPIAAPSAGDRILNTDLGAFYNLLKGVAGSGEAVTLVYNAAGVIAFIPSSDPAATTQLFQIKNAASTVKSALTAGGGALFSSQVNFAKGSDIASAGTTDLSTITGNYAQVSGTTTITAFGTVQAGTIMVLEFQGALTLTHNASSLILRAGANATTASGDIYIFVSEGSGNWREISHLVTAASTDIAADQQTQYWHYTYSGDMTPGETTVTGTGSVIITGQFADRRLDTGATSGSTAGMRTVARSTQVYAIGKVRRLELLINWVQSDANTTAYVLATSESVTGAPSLTADHIGIKNVAGVISFTTADGTTEQTTNITSFVTVGNDQTYDVTNDGTTVKLYIDGTLRATHATNVPRSTLNAWVVMRAYITNSTAASKKLDLMRFDILVAV